jgi:hypothetical protein
MANIGALPLSRLGGCRCDGLDMEIKIRYVTTEEWHRPNGMVLSEAVVSHPGCFPPVPFTGRIQITQI